MFGTVHRLISGSIFCITFLILSLELLPKMQDEFVSEDII